MTRQPSSRTDDITGTSRDDARESVLSKAADRAVEATAGVRDAAQDALEEQKDDAAERIDQVASSIRTASDELRENDEDIAARYVELGAERLSELAGYLRGKSIHQLGREASRAAPAHPAVCLGGALFAGILIGRFFRSSADRDAAGSYDDEPVEIPEVFE